MLLRKGYLFGRRSPEAIDSWKRSCPETIEPYELKKKGKTASQWPSRRTSAQTAAEPIPNLSMQAKATRHSANTEGPDEETNDNTTLTEDPPPIPYSTACSMVKMLVQDEPMQHSQTVAVYGKQSAGNDRNGLRSHSKKFLIAQLRSGHQLAFKTYQHQINDKKDPTCLACSEEEHTIEH